MNEPVCFAKDTGKVVMIKCDVCAEPITTKSWLMTWDKDMGLTLNVCKWCNPSKFNLSSEVNNG